MAQQVTAASAAAARQTIPAAGASEGLGSQVKNLAFPPFLILQSSLRCPGLVYIPSPGSMSRCISKNFWEFSGVFIPKVARKFAGRARCENPCHHKPQKRGDFTNGSLGVCTKLSQRARCLICQVLFIHRLWVTTGVWEFVSL